MIRIREIALPPEHSVAQLSFEAAQALRISVSKIRKLRIVRRSVDARKKPDVKIIYTVDVAVDGNEMKVLKQSGCKRAALANDNYFKVRKAAKQAAGNTGNAIYIQLFKARKGIILLYRSGKNVGNRCANENKHHLINLFIILIYLIFLKTRSLKIKKQRVSLYRSMAIFMVYLD